jgi:hypothetical protein
VARFDAAVTELAAELQTEERRERQERRRERRHQRTSRHSWQRWLAQRMHLLSATASPARTVMIHCLAVVPCPAQGVLSRMSPARPLMRIDPLDPFADILRPRDATPPVILQSARDADQATIAFHAERQRLTQRRVEGDLLLMRQQKAWALLWEPLR